MRCASIFVALAACNDDLCVDDVCASPEETRTFPGPCTSRIHGFDENGAEQVVAGSFVYDVAGNVRFVRSAFDGWSDLMQTHIQRQSEMLWQYDASGAVTAIDASDATWRFDDQHVTVTSSVAGTTSVYDRAAFRFAAMPGRARRMSPYSDFGLISVATNATDIHAFTYERAGQTLTRTETDQDHAVVRTVVFQLDDRDRVVSSTLTYGDDASFAADDAFEYRGDLLVRHRHFAQVHAVETRETYDRGGNLILEETLDGIPPVVSVREAFGYDCWK